MVDRLCVQADTVFKCLLTLVEIVMCFIFQFYDNVNLINWKHSCKYLLLLKSITHEMHPAGFLW